MAMTGGIRVGIGGWSYEPWRGSFYPPGLAHADELAYASRRLSAIEINSTYHGTQRRASFAKWRDSVPDGFVFSVKASRYATQRRVLAEAGESIERFIGSGVAELGDRLGPIVWQLPPTHAYDEGDMAAFLQLLPRAAEGVALRHAIEARHASFAVPAFIALARRHGVAIVFGDAERFPSIGDVTADFVYARLMRSQAELEHGYAPAALDAIATTAREWAQGLQPGNVPRVDGEAEVPAQPREVYVYFIDGAKEKAPAAALALRERLG
jgi:uncharacterized protein YecE (DUF72 family)